MQLSSLVKDAECKSTFQCTNIFQTINDATLNLCINSSCSKVSVVHAAMILQTAAPVLGPTAVLLQATAAV